MLILLDSKIRDEIRNILIESQGKPVNLQCGVYGEKNSIAPPIDVIVVAIEAEAESLNFIAITIDVKAGFQKDSSAYGVKKIEVFSRGVFLSAPRLETAGKKSKPDVLFEKIVDIVPAEG